MGRGLWAASCLGGTKKQQQPIVSGPKAELSDSTGPDPDLITSNWPNSIISLVVRLWAQQGLIDAEYLGPSQPSLCPLIESSSLPRPDRGRGWKFNFGPRSFAGTACVLPPTVKQVEKSQSLLVLLWAGLLPFFFPGLSVLEAGGHPRPGSHGSPSFPDDSTRAVFAPTSCKDPCAGAGGTSVKPVGSLPPASKCS